jgi:hypothetical protein
VSTAVFHDRDDWLFLLDDPDFLDCGWPRIGAIGWKSRG